MTTPYQPTVHEVMSEATAQTLRSAIRARRNELLTSWLRAFHFGIMDDDGCGFWAIRIRQLHDAAIECGFGYD